MICRWVSGTLPSKGRNLTGLVEFNISSPSEIAAYHAAEKHASPVRPKAEDVNLLRESRMYALSAWKSSEAFNGISDAPKLDNPRTVIGRSELLAGRSKSAKRKR